MSRSCLKNPKLPKMLSAKPFSRKGEWGMWLVIANLCQNLCSWDLVMDREWCSCKPLLNLCSDKKGQDSQVQLSHPEDFVLAKRRQISVGSWLPQGPIPRTCPAVANGTRCPGSSQPSCSVGHLNSGGQDSWSAQRRGSGRGPLLPQSLGLVSWWPWWGP